MYYEYLRALSFLKYCTKLSVLQISIQFRESALQYIKFMIFIVCLDFTYISIIFLEIFH